MTQAKRPSKKPAARARSRGARTTRDKGASGRTDFSEILALIADAKQRGVLDAKHRTRTVARPRAKSTPAAPFPRIVAGAKTEDQQLRALKAAAQRELTPGDNQGARFNLAALEAGKTWEEMEDAER
jgi:hypothetical protein